MARRWAYQPTFCCGSFRPWDAERFRPSPWFARQRRTGPSPARLSPCLRKSQTQLLRSDLSSRRLIAIQCRHAQTGSGTYRRREEPAQGKQRYIQVTSRNWRHPGARSCESVRTRAQSPAETSNRFEERRILRHPRPRSRTDQQQPGAAPGISTFPCCCA